MKALITEYIKLEFLILLHVHMATFICSAPSVKCVLHFSSIYSCRIIHFHLTDHILFWQMQK